MRKEHICLLIALMEISIWGFVTVAVIHFDNPWVYIAAVAGSLSLPSFDKGKRYENNETTWIDE